MALLFDYLKLFWANAPLIFATTVASQVFKLDILPFIFFFFICYIIVNYINLPPLAVMGVFIIAGLVLGFTMAQFPSSATLCAIIAAVLYVIQLVIFFVGKQKSK